MGLKINIPIGSMVSDVVKSFFKKPITGVIRLNARTRPTPTVELDLGPGNPPLPALCKRLPLTRLN